MAADEQIRLFANQFRLRSPVVVAWIPADVGHVDANAVTLPSEAGRQISANLGAVDIAVDSAHRLQAPQAIQQRARSTLARSHVARVPQFVAIFEVLQQSLVEKAVRIGKQTDGQCVTSSARRP